MGRGRPPMPLGTWGHIQRTELEPGRWYADCWVRDLDGITRRARRHTPTGVLDRKGAAAERVLIDHLDALTVNPVRESEMAKNVEAKGRTGGARDITHVRESPRPKTVRSAAHCCGRPASHGRLSRGRPPHRTGPADVATGRQTATTHRLGQRQQGGIGQTQQGGMGIHHRGAGAPRTNPDAGQTRGPHRDAAGRPVVPT